MKAFRSRALLLRSVPYGETDLIVTLLTEERGKLGARLRGGRRSAKRASGGVEPFHTLDVALEDRGGDLLPLKETQLVVVRAGLVASLGAMDAAGIALRWSRHLLPVRHAEPEAWSTLTRLLDRLDALAPEGDPAKMRGVLALAGFHLLASVGYALELGRCVVCGRACPPGAPAFVDGPRGGLVCRACGGGGRLLDGRARELAARAQLGEEHGSERDGWTLPAWVTEADADRLLAVLGDAMAAHAGMDAASS